MPTPAARTELHLGSSCAFLVTAVAAGIVPFAWCMGIRNCRRIIPDTALLSAEVMLLQDNAGPVSCV